LVDPKHAGGDGSVAVIGLTDLAALRPQAARRRDHELSTDPEFISKVRNVVSLYMRRPEHALVLATDEKSQIQAPDRTARSCRGSPTTPQRCTHDYVPHGTEF
jgi:hypothetical protein